MFHLHHNLQHIFHQGLTCLEFVKHLSFHFQEVDMNFSWKVVDEGVKILCFTMRCGFHQSAHMVQWHFFQVHAIDHFFQLLKTFHVEVAKSLVPKPNSFIWRLCHMCIFLSNIDVKKIQVLLPSCFNHDRSTDIVHLTTILVKLHFQAFRNKFANRNETIIHFGNMKNLSDSCKQHFTSNLHHGLYVPFKMMSFPMYTLHRTMDS